MERYISLAFVRMAVRRSTFENQWCYAITSRYHPVLNHDGTWLHGHCVITTKD